MSGETVVERLNAALEGRYRLERELGEGGMATVYLADDLKHQRRVALKVLKPELAAVVGAERFLAEIRTTAALQHPHILPLFDSGEADGFLFYVMPYVQGESLRERLDRERQLPVDEAVAMARKMADALDYAHGEGVVHRDVKPANVLLSERGEPLVADFGIALAVSQAGGGRITETGLSMGTPHYMSPEQASGDRSVDRRSDIYGLGCVLYEMLTGEPPYGGGTAQSVLAKILTEEPRRVTGVRRTVAPNVDAAVARALEKLPADRFDSAAAFREALGDAGFRHDPAGVAAPAPRGAVPEPVRSGPGRTAMGVTLGAVALAAAAFAVGRATAPEAPRPAARFMAAPPAGVTPVSVCCGPIQALSPDGRTLVFVGTGSGRRALFRRDLDRLEAEEIPGTEGASTPFFSPDGRWVGFHAEGRLRRVPLAGGPPVTIVEVERVDGATWGDDDVVVVSVPDDSLYTVPAAGGSPVGVAVVSGGYYAHPSALPGGGAVVARILGASDEPRIAVVDLETGASDTVGFGTRVVYASRHLLISGSDGTLLAQPFDPGERRTTGPAVAIVDGVRTAGPSVGEFAVSATGDLAYIPGGGLGFGFETLVIHGPGGPVEVPLAEEGNLEDVAFSPDGRRLAFRSGSSAERGEVWIWDRDQQTQQLLGVEGRPALAPVWSPDGARIAFTPIGGQGPEGIHWQPADGSGAVELLLESPSNAWPSDFTPDGGTLVFVAERETGMDVGLLDLDQGTVRWLVETPGDDRHGQVSPDGRFLAYTSDRSGNDEVYVQAVDGTGGRTQISAGGGNSPRWAPDGETIYYATNESAPILAARVSTAGGIRVLGRGEAFEGVDDLNGETITWDVSPDGEAFVYISRTSDSMGDGWVWILDWPRLVRAVQGGGPTR